MLTKLASKVNRLDQLDNSILKRAAQQANQDSFSSLSRNLGDTRSLAYATAGSHSLAQQPFVNLDFDSGSDQLSGQMNDFVDSGQKNLPRSQSAQTNGLGQTELSHRQAIDTTQYLRFQPDSLSSPANTDIGSVQRQDIEPQTLLPQSGTTPVAAAESPWNLVWSDEFNDSTLDPTKWEVYRGDFGLPYREQWYTDRPKNVRVEDGSLVLQAHNEPQIGGGVDYSSGMVNSNNVNLGDNGSSKGNVAWTYGRFEIRAKLPYSQGAWPALWMRPLEGQGGWPRSGEIDIVEYLGPQSDRPTGPVEEVVGNIHWQGANGERRQKQGRTSLPQIDAEQFHTYALEWTEEGFKWFIDDNLFHEVDDWSNNILESPAPFDQPFFFTFNLQVGGWAGEPDPNAFPNAMEIDWVRVYQEDAEGGEPAPPTPPTPVGEQPIYGSDENDTLSGQGNDDQIYGRKGDDLITGGVGNDTINGDLGNDLLRGGAGNDRMAGGLGNDTLNGDRENDLLYGGAGSDQIAGGLGNDTLNGDQENDRLFGGQGADRIIGGVGNDILNGDNQNDLLYGGKGNDTVMGGAGQDTLHGGSGNDQLNGGQGNDVILGEGGLDILRSGSRSDQDIFIINDAYLGNGYARIVDFSHTGSNRDKIDVSRTPAAYTIDASTNLVGGTQRDSQILLNGDQIAVIEDVTLSSSDLI